MKHIKTFESFDQKIDEIWGQKFATGHGSTEEKNAAKAKIEADINNFMSQATFKFSNPEKYKTVLLDKAKANNWKGNLVWGKDAKSGASYPVYKNGESGLNAVGGSAAAGTRALASY